MPERFQAKGRLRFVAKGVALTALIMAPLAVFFHNHAIGIDPQQETCLPYHVWLYETGRDVKLAPGDYVVFRMDNRGQPFFTNGQTFVKRIAAAPGDTVVVTKGWVFIDGRKVKRVSKHVAERMHKATSDYDKHLVLAKGQYWAMGDHPNSFDSTYWGVLRRDQIIGRAIPVL